MTTSSIATLLYQLPTLSIPIYLVNVDKVGTITKWELTKWEVDKVGINKVGVDEVGRYPPTLCNSLGYIPCLLKVPTRHEYFQANVTIHE